MLAYIAIVTGRGGGTYIELIPLSHQSIVQQMPVHLRLDQHQINEQDYGIVLNVFVAEAAAVLADREAHSMAGGFVVGAGVFGVQSLDGIAALYADRHFIDVSGILIGTQMEETRYWRAWFRDSRGW